MEVKNIIRKIADLIQKGYQPEKIILFGSYAYGSPDQDSDIDLLIIKETSERPLDRRVMVSRLVSDPSRRIPLEVIVLTPREVRKRLEGGDQFLDEILHKGKILYGS